MTKEIIIKAIGEDDAFFDCVECLVGQKMTVASLHKDTTVYRKYGWHGTVRTQEEITFPDKSTWPAGACLSFFDIDIEKA